MNNLEEKDKTTKYHDGLTAYIASVESMNLASAIDSLRLETQFEALYDWSLLHSIEDVDRWFLEQQSKCEMVIEDIPLHDCENWFVDEETGWIKHISGEFFYIQGIRISQSSGREVGAKGWDQPILTQVGYDGGLLGMLRKRIKGVPHYLVEAKAEPGNYDFVQMSPTLQATFSNIKMAHKGNKPRFSEYFEEPERHNCKVLYNQWMSEDGGRLLKKRNRGMLVEIPEHVDVDVPDSFIWMSLWQIKDCLKRNSWVNPHIRSIIANL